MTVQAPPQRASARTVPVAEAFYSFQGEGTNLGRRALFVRLMHCNLTCGYRSLPHGGDVAPDGPMVCDTAYTWNRALPGFGGGVRHLTVEEIWNELMALDPSARDASIAPVDLIVASGGEPLLRQDVLIDLADLAADTGRQMEIETNATITPRPELVANGVFFNASPKLSSSAVPRGKRIKAAAITALHTTGRVRWKFVVAVPEDLEEVAAIQAEFGLTEVWVSPEGRTAEQVGERMRMAADAALARGWNLTTRAHVLIWGDQRGK